MGYSHYMNHTKPFDDLEWEHILTAIDTLVAQADKENLPLSADNGDTPISNHQRIERAWLREGRNGPMIALNGMGEDAHETFCIFKNGPGDSDGFEFCKTAMKPYDQLAVAALCWVETHYPDRLNAYSDGDADDWQTGLEFARRAFPEGTIELPPRVRSRE